jgi:hypothetical protein
MEKYIGDINFKYIKLICIMYEIENPDIQKTQILPLNSNKDKIMIQKIGYEVNVENLFYDLFVNENNEFTK